MTCEICGGTGWMHVATKGRASGVARCACRTAVPQRGRDDPTSVLADPDREIARIIMQRRGKANAISIEEICKGLWPSAWYGGGSSDAVELHKRRNELARTVKASVERIRREARLPIAATKASPGGYYVPVTAEECDECYRRMVNEGVKLILNARLFRPEADIVQELRGQLKL
jgi:hypothetical protein